MRFLLALALAACGETEGDRQNDARLLLQRIDAVRGIPDADLSARRDSVDELRALPVRGEELIRVRDACAEMHGALTEADEQTALVRQLGAPTEETPPDEMRRIARAFHAAESAAARVEQYREACVEGVAELRERYVPSRRDG